MQKWLLPQMTKMRTTCSKERRFLPSFFRYITPQNLSLKCLKRRKSIKMLNKCCQNRVQRRKKKSQIAVLQQFGIDFERCLAESNRCSRFCRPVPNRSAKAPFPYWDCKYRDFCGICKIYFAFLFFNSEITVDSP